jgi:methylenetetrahydrofolate dehydrogenase (NADP+) / methenyltetrahydrofolate cyclohydrolase
MIIDGKLAAAELCVKVASMVGSMQVAPHLAVVLVGDNPASRVYVGAKGKKCKELGMGSSEYILPESTTQEDLIALVDKLNDDKNVNGILVQLPLPKHLSEAEVIQRISPAKDVDGFHAINTGKLWIGDKTALLPCTPHGCLQLVQQVLGDDLSGKHAVVIGRSNIVGKPMAGLLLGANATITIAHSKTQNLKDICKQADILVACELHHKRVC